MPGSRELQRRRHNLMKVSPYCDECGVECVYYKLAEGEVPPDNFATIQHVNSRIAYPDGRPARGERILMCYRCNQEDARTQYEAAKAEKRRQELIDAVIPVVQVPRPRRRKRP